MDHQKTAAQMNFLKHAIIDASKSKMLWSLQDMNLNVIFTYMNGDTVLHLILKNDQFSPNEILEVMNIFIARGVDPNIANCEGETVLHLAVAKRLKDVMDLLLKHKTKLDVTDSEGHSIAHAFIENEMRQFVTNQDSTVEEQSASFLEWMLSRGFDFDQQNKMGQSALHWAIEFNLQHILSILLKHTRDINFVCKRNRRTLLHSFIVASNEGKGNGHDFEHPDLSHVKPLVPRLRIPSARFSQRYDIEIVKTLLERGVSVDHVDRWGLTPLHLAVESWEKLDFVELLCERFTRVRDACAVTLTLATMENAEYWTILKALIAKGVDVNAKDPKGMPLVYYAVKLVNAKATKLMKDGGASFDMITRGGGNLLHVLAEATNYEEPCICDIEALFDLLVGEGCDVNAKDNGGLTPLHVAVRNNNIVVARNLISYGADVNCREYEQELCPLHTAVGRGLIELVKLLLASGAKVNSKSRRNVRPIHIAANFSGTNALTVLLKHEAEVNARDSGGVTALAKVLVAKSSSNVRELLARGADIADRSVVRALSICGENEMSWILSQHWLKLKVAKLPCSEIYLNSMNDQEFRQLQRDFSAEVETLRNTFIYKRTSIYDWLHMGFHRRYVYNEKLHNTVNSTNFTEQFPEYSAIIFGIYRETLRRKSFVEPAKEAWLMLTEIYLPDTCLERKFVYLDTVDLFEMAEIINEPSGSEI